MNLPIQSIQFGIGFLVFIFWLGPIPIAAEKIRTDLEQDRLQGPVRNVQFKLALPKKKSTMLKALTYDRRGHRKELTIYNPDGSVNSRAVFRHDAAGNKIDEELFSGGSRLLSKRIWRYDSSGRKTKDALFAGDGQPVYLILRSYGPHGRLLEERFVSPLRPVENKSIQFEYNAQDRRRSETRLDHKNIPYQKRIFFYGKSRNLIRTALFKLEKTASGKMMRMVLENRMYDKLERLSETTEFLSDGRFWKRWKYDYDRAGYKTQETFYLKPDKIESRWIYLRDPNSRRLLEERYEKAGKPVFVKTHSYDPIKNKLLSPNLENPQLNHWLYNHRIDQHGNWFEKTVRKWETDQVEPEIVRTYHRIIEYY